MTLQFLVLTFFLEITPGPAVLFVLYQSSNGYKNALVGILGLLSANLLWISLVATGLGLILAQSVIAFTVMRWLGGAYLAYLGYKIIRHGLQNPSMATDRKENSLAKIYLQGILTSLSNPKALLFFLALFPNFTRVDYFIQDIVYFGSLKMALLFVVMSSYALLGQRIFNMLQLSRLAQIIVRTLGGGIIIAAIAVVRN